MADEDLRDYVVHVVIEIACPKQVDGPHARAQARLLVEGSLPAGARFLAVDHCRLAENKTRG